MSCARERGADVTAPLPPLVKIDWKIIALVKCAAPQNRLANWLTPREQMRHSSWLFVSFHKPRNDRENLFFQPISISFIDFLFCFSSLFIFASGRDVNEDGRFHDSKTDRINVNSRQGGGKRKTTLLCFIAFLFAPHSHKFSVNRRTSSDITGSI